MKVKELIKELSKHDPEMEVFIEVGEEGHCDAYRFRPQFSVREKSIWHAAILTKNGRNGRTDTAVIIDHA